MSNYRRLRIECLESRWLLAAELQIASQIPARPGTQVDVPVQLDESGGVLAIDLTIRYDTSQLRFDGVDVGALLDSGGWRDQLQVNHVAADGSIRLTTFDSEALADASGAAFVLSFTPQADAAGTSILDIVTAENATQLNEGQLEFSAVDGSLLIQAANTATLTLPQTTVVRQGDTVTLPVTISGAVDWLSGDLVVTYDASIASATEVTLGDLTRTAGWSLESNLANGGRIQLSMFDTDPLTGSGEILELTFQVAGDAAADAESVLDIVEEESQLNERQIPLVANDGRLRVTALLDVDLGDAPLSSQSGFAADYPTRLPGGAAHTTGSGPRLGTAIDIDEDGQPTAGADGDDLDADGDDEDGVRAIASLVATAAEATLSSFLVTASAAGKLDAWIDFNRDGDWSDDGEQVAASAEMTSGENVLVVTVPAGAARGVTFARFRISSSGGLMPGGPAADGEVEDYAVEILNGDTGADIVVEPPAGTTELLEDGGDLVARQGTVELFRAPGTSVTGVAYLGSDADDTLTIGDLRSVFSGALPLGGDGRGGFDTFLLTAGDHDLPLTSLPAGTISNLERLDVRGTGANRVALSPDVVADITDANGVLQVLADREDRILIGENWSLARPEFIDGVFFRKVTRPTGTTLLLHSPPHWRNPVLPEDVTGDGNVFPRDALLLVNAINFGIENPLPVPTPDNKPPTYFDPSGDGNLFPRDVLDVVNFINRAANQQAEGEPDEPDVTAEMPVWFATTPERMDDRDHPDDNQLVPDGPSVRGPHLVGVHERSASGPFELHGRPAPYDPQADGADDEPAAVALSDALLTLLATELAALSGPH